MAAYLALQLDPKNEQQTVAFEALCLKHILHRASSYWVQQAQSRAFSLARKIKTDEPTKRKIYGWDHTSNRLTSEFVQSYAGILWPVAEDQRANLRPNTGIQFQLQAVSAYM